jgi:hypothetical protein
MFRMPRTISGLILDFGIAAFDMLSARGGLCRGKCCAMRGKCFGPDIAKAISIATIVLSDVIGNLHRAISCCAHAIRMGSTIPGKH